MKIASVAQNWADAYDRDLPVVLRYKHGGKFLTVICPQPEGYHHSLCYEGNLVNGDRITDLAVGIEAFRGEEVPMIRMTFRRSGQELGSVEASFNCTLGEVVAFPFDSRVWKRVDITGQIFRVSSNKQRLTT